MIYWKTDKRRPSTPLRKRGKGLGCTTSVLIQCSPKRHSPLTWTSTLLQIPRSTMDMLKHIQQIQEQYHFDHHFRQYASSPDVPSTHSSLWNLEDVLCTFTTTAPHILATTRGSILGWAFLCNIGQLQSSTVKHLGKGSMIFYTMICDNQLPKTVTLIGLGVQRRGKTMHLHNQRMEYTLKPVKIHMKYSIVWTQECYNYMQIPSKNHSASKEECPQRLVTGLLRDLRCWHHSITNKSCKASP